MRLHIVMVVLNCLSLTKQAVESINTKLPYSLHIVDQDSNDGTREWAESHSSMNFWYHRFTPRTCLSEAWNLGIREALKDPECEYIFIPNNDVIFHKTTIDNLIESIDKLGYAMVTGNNVQPEMPLASMQMRDEWGDWDHDSRPIQSWIDEGPDFSCFLIKRDFTAKYGYFDENFKPAYCEDQDMHIRLNRAGANAKRMSRAPYYHIASQTLAGNSNIAPEIYAGHEKNKGYYRSKWGVEHGEALKGGGHATPYGDPTKDIKFWYGSEKYD